MKKDNFKPRVNPGLYPLIVIPNRNPKGMYLVLRELDLFLFCTNFEDGKKELIEAIVKKLRETGTSIRQDLETLELEKKEKVVFINLFQEIKKQGYTPTAYNKKTLTLKKYISDMAEESDLNLSQILTEEILKELVKGGN